MPTRRVKCASPLQTCFLNVFFANRSEVQRLSRISKFEIFQFKAGGRLINFANLMTNSKVFQIHAAHFRLMTKEQFILAILNKHLASVRFLAKYPPYCQVTRQSVVFCYCGVFMCVEQRVNTLNWTWTEPKLNCFLSNGNAVAGISHDVWSCQKKCFVTDVAS